MDLDPTRLRVMKLIQQRRTDLKKASLAIGRNAAYLQQYLYRGIPKTLPEDAREALAAFLGVPEESLRPGGKESTLMPASVSMPPAIAAASVSAMGGSMPGFSQIPELDVRASAGHGAFHEGDEEIKAVWMFPDAVIRHELRARSVNLRIITIDGDSMEPLLASGDRVLVDTSQRVPAPPGIFVIWDGLGIVAKRIEHIPTAEPSRIVIKSVNPIYGDYERPTEDVNIIGRVIWAGKKL
ncbi:MAG: helix-turn-helix transcriptional regulator [Acetobacteraceae bacterium]|jgi:phage repressor protein C with HTH and peptisase S24 domain|nr:helix-turn-helix transcriptional regulator [Acetobacteraceae bacterium]